MGLRSKIRKGIEKIVGEEDATADEIKKISNNKYHADTEDLLRLSRHLVQEAEHLEYLKEYIVGYGEEIDRGINEMRQSDKFRRAVEKNDTRISNKMQSEIEEYAERENAEELYLQVYRGARKVLEEEIENAIQVAEDKRVIENLEEARSIMQNLEEAPVDSTSRRRFLKGVAGGVLASAGAAGAGELAKDALKNLEEDKQKVSGTGNSSSSGSPSQSSEKAYRVEADEELRSANQTRVSNASRNAIDTVKAYNNQNLYSGNGIYVGKIGIEDIVLSQEGTSTDGQTEVTSFSYKITLSGREELSTISGETEKQAIELLFSQILLVIRGLEPFIEVQVEGKPKQLVKIELEIVGSNEGYAVVGFSRERSPSMEDYLEDIGSEDRKNKILEEVKNTIIWQPAE